MKRKCIFLEMATVNTMYCDQCKSFHNMSFGLNPTNKEKRFYKDSYQMPYFQTSNETIFELSLLNDLHASILIQTSSFRSFAASYNYNRGFSILDRNRLLYKRLIEVYFTWHLANYFKQFSTKHLSSKFSYD